MERDDSGVEDLAVEVGLGLLKEPGRAKAGAAGVSFGTDTDAGVGRPESLLFKVGSLDKRGIPRGMPVGLEVVCEWSMVEAV